jgi:hypothetical protein
MTQFRRVLAVLWIPPVVGVGAMLIYPRPFSESGGMLNFDPAWMALTVAAAFGFCLVPALASWAVIEVARTRIRLFHSFYPYCLLGSLLGLLASSPVCSYFQSLYPRNLGESLIGIASGALVAAVIYPRSKNSIQIPTVSAARRACVIFGAVAISGLTLAIVLWAAWRIEYHRPSEQSIRGNFSKHRADFVHFAQMVGSDGCEFISSNGSVSIGGLYRRNVPEYGRLMRAIRAISVQVAENGTIEFTLGGFGGAISSDSYAGVYFNPNDSSKKSGHGWDATIVRGISDEQLPKENGLVATGLYVIPIEQHWYVYRFEYQE